MNLASVIARIDTQCPSFKVVGGAAQFDKAVASLTRAPAAFVLLGSELATPSPFMEQLVEQRVAVDLVVVIATKNLEDARGRAAADDLDSLRGSVRDALLKFVPTGATDGIEYQRGALMLFANGVLWWADTFGTHYMIRST
jgi:hypothetical protein